MSGSSEIEVHRSPCAADKEAFESQGTFCLGRCSLACLENTLFTACAECLRRKQGSRTSPMRGMWQSCWRQGSLEFCSPYRRVLSPRRVLCWALSALGGHCGCKWKSAKAGVPSPWILAGFSLSSSSSPGTHLILGRRGFSSCLLGVESSA